MLKNLNTLITCFQILGIGFSFGLYGPCLVNYFVILSFILPLSKIRKSFKYILSFLSGRFCAYLLLGFIVGESAKLLREFLSSNFISYFENAGAIIIIALGISLIFKKEEGFCKRINIDFLSVGNLFLLGGMVGILPCIPLLALLTEISLVSKNGAEGAFYMFFFGVGIFFSSLIVLIALNSVLVKIIKRTIASPKVKLGLRLFCAILLIVLGIRLIIQKKLSIF